jgi:hypothetical protein
VYLGEYRAQNAFVAINVASSREGAKSFFAELLATSATMT